MDHTNLEFYKSSVDYILAVQNNDGSIPWEIGKKLDPWDHIEAAMGLAIAGKKEETDKIRIDFENFINLKIHLISTISGEGIDQLINEILKLKNI